MNTPGGENVRWHVRSLACDRTCQSCIDPILVEISFGNLHAVSVMLMLVGLLLSIVQLAGATVPPVAWTIAGSDAGGGAGIQADLHTFQALGVHGCSAITALTAQNSVEVRMVEYPSLEFLRTTLAALRDDLPARAIKLGMLGSRGVVAEVASFLATLEEVDHSASGGPLVVCDPVMVTTSGSRLLDADATAALTADLFPRCRLITPNLVEAEALLGR